MTEYIKRDDALDCFHDWIDKHGDVCEACDMPEYRAIEQLPVIELPHWIPTSVRLPEENLPVLVAVKQEDRLPSWVKERTHSYVTDIDVYDDGWYLHKNKVVAWQELPEPYGGARC